jgi:PKD repeat protein
MTGGQDVICSEAIGTGADVDWLRDEIVFPQPGCDWPIAESSPTCRGWVREVTDAEEFADTICEKLGAIIAEPPVCDFTATPRTGTAPLRVQFTDLSTGGIESWAWDFDNDGVTDSTQQNPSHAYIVAGTYTVSMTATGPAGSCTETKVAYITVRELPMEEEEPPNLVAAYLLISPEQVLPNQEVTISISIGNDGGTAGTRSIALYINGNLEDSQTVTVSAGSSKTVVFTVTKSAPGTYQVMLEGNVGQFTVLGTAGQWGGPLGVGGIIAIVVIVIALVVGLVFILKRE